MRITSILDSSTISSLLYSGPAYNEYTCLATLGSDCILYKILEKFSQLSLFEIAFLGTSILIEKLLISFCLKQADIALETTKSSPFLMSLLAITPLDLFGISTTESFGDSNSATSKLKHSFFIY